MCIYSEEIKKQNRNEEINADNVQLSVQICFKYFSADKSLESDGCTGEKKDPKPERKDQMQMVYSTTSTINVKCK